MSMLVPIKKLVQPCKTWNPVNHPDEQFHYIDISSVDRDLKKITSTNIIYGKDAPSRARQIANSNDVLVSTVRPNLNAVAKIPENLDGATVSTGFTVLRPTEFLDSGYLFHWVKTDFFIQDMIKKSTGANYPAVSDRIILDSLIPLPNIEEQRRIAAILDKAEALRAKRREAITKLDQLLQSVFLEMFGDPASNPKNWPIGKISEMLEGLSYGSSSKADISGDVPMLRMNNITYSGEINIDSLKYLSEESAEKYLVSEGDILFNRTNSKELVGKTAVYYGPMPMAYAGYLIKGVVKKEHCAEYISAFMNSKYGKKLLQSMCKSIVGMANINAKEFGAIEIPFPPNDLQIKFKSKIKEINSKKSLMIKQEKEILNLSMALQQQYFQ